jgi:hypothetical protein
MADRDAVVVAGPAGPERSRVERALRSAGLRPVREAPAPVLTVLMGDAAVPPWPPPPVIVVSSRTDIDSFTNAITSGAAAYLASPVDEGELAASAARLARWRQGPVAGNTRRSARRPLLLEVDLAAGARRMRGHLLDVSASGCRVEVEGSVRRGEEVAFTPRALGASTGIALGAVVTWTRRAGRDGPCTAALRFNATSALLAGRIFGAPAARRPGSRAR